LSLDARGLIRADLCASVAESLSEIRLADIRASGDINRFNSKPA
jgi:hypothetical protein